MPSEEQKKAKEARERYNEELRKFFAEERMRLRDVSELPSNAEILETIDLVEARNKRIQALQEKSDTIEEELNNKLERLKELEAHTITRPIPTPPSRDENRVVSAKLAVEDILRKVAKPAIDKLKNELNQCQEQIKSWKEKAVDLERKLELETKEVQVQKRLVDGTTKATFDVLEERNKLIKARREEKDLWVKEKERLNQEISSERTNLAEAIATAEREQSNITRVKDVILEQRDKAVKVQMEERNMWIKEKDRLNAEIITGRTNLAQEIATAAREKSELTSAKDAMVQQQDKVVKVLQEEKEALIKERERLKQEILTEKTNLTRMNLENLGIIRSKDAHSEQQDIIVKALQEEKEALIKEKECLKQEMLNEKTSLTRTNLENLEIIRSKDAQSEQQDKIVKALQEEKEALIKEKECLKQEMLNEKTNLTQMNHKNLELTHVKDADVAQKQSRISALEATIIKSEESFAQAIADKTESMRLKVVELDDTKKALKESEKLTGSLKSKILEHEKQIQQNEERYETCKDELRQKTRDLGSSNQQITVLQTDACKAASDAEASATAHQATLQAMSSLQEKIESAQASLTEVKAEKENLLDEIKRLRSNITALQGVIKTKCKDVAELNTELTSATEQIKTLQDELDSMIRFIFNNPLPMKIFEKLMQPTDIGYGTEIAAQRGVLRVEFCPISPESYEELFNDILPYAETADIYAASLHALAKEMLQYPEQGCHVLRTITAISEEIPSWVPLTELLEPLPIPEYIISWVYLWCNTLSAFPIQAPATINTCMSLNCTIDEIVQEVCSDCGIALKKVRIDGVYKRVWNTDTTVSWWSPEGEIITLELNAIAAGDDVGYDFGEGIEYILGSAWIGSR